MSLFGCSHVWRNYGRKHYGTQQQRCSKCGTLKNKRVRRCFLNRHRWKLDRRRRGRVFVCRKCGISQDYTKPELDYEDLDDMGVNTI
jgi:hypothetical protein